MEGFYKELCDSIIDIYDGNGENLSYKNKEIKKYRVPHSKKNLESVTIFLDGIPLTGNKRKKRKVKFRCSCGNVSIIHISKFLTKEKLSCPKCRENKEKIAWHKLFFEMKRRGLERGHKNSSKKPKSIYSFNNEEEQFKTEFFEKHLTEKEFYKILPHIEEIDNINIKDKNIIFLPCEPIENQFKYTQKVLIDNEKHKLDVKLKCPICGAVFHISRLLKERVVSNNFDCKECYLVNKKFKKQRFSENLTYQSKTELLFINECLKNNIKIIDGRKIKYIFDNKEHSYSIDFELPELKILVEIKDNHIWHKKQVESGKWFMKSNSAISFSNEIGYEFMLLFENDFENFFDTITRRDSLNSVEKQRS